MRLAFNPSREKIQSLIERSKRKAATWIKDVETGDMWYWPAGQAQAARVAKAMHVEHYEHGLATKDKSS